MKIAANLLKERADDILVQVTETINNMNPVVNRLMADESVGGVIMTNKEGTPIISNINSHAAVAYSAGLQRLGTMANYCVKEIDKLDEVMVIRCKTKKIELLVAPHKEFNIIVIQHGRPKPKNSKTGKLATSIFTNKV